MNLPGVSPLQYILIIVNTSFGAGMLTTPRAVAEIANVDMWLTILFSGLLFLVAFWSAVKLSQYFPKHTCIEYHRILLGPILGQLLNVVLILLLIIITALSLRVFGIALKIILFNLTPPQIVVFTLLLLAVYATQYGLAPVLRTQQLISMSNNLLLIPILLLGLLTVNINYCQPLLTKGFTPVIKGVVPSWFAYSGPELIVGLIYPFISRKNLVVKWGTAGIILLIIIYTLLAIIIQGTLTPKEAAHLLVPTISAYREIEIPDTFIERIDGYLMILWIPLYYTSLINLFYFSSFAASRLLNLESSRPVTLLLVPLVYYLVNLPPNMQTYNFISDYYIIANMLWGLGIVPLLLVIAWFKDKRQSTC